MCYEIVKLTPFSFGGCARNLPDRNVCFERFLLNEKSALNKRLLPPMNSASIIQISKKCATPLWAYF